MRGRSVARALGAIVVVSAVIASVGASARAAGGVVGYDLSYPQCNQPFPTDGAFGIVGVNAGLPFSVNPCLGLGDGPSQLQWAGTGAQLYANTANPGPTVSAHWPNGQEAPQACSPGGDTPACAYDYGWNAALDSYQDAVNAYIAIGLGAAGSTRTPAANVWWLDVESTNSWETNVANNVAALQGAVDALKSVGAAGVGFYASAFEWQMVTGGTAQFAAYPFWAPGAASLADAEARCAALGANGGPVSLVQFPASPTLGADTTCVQQPALTFVAPPATIAAGVTSAPLTVTIPQAAAAPLTISLSSSSATGRFAAAAGGPWTAALAISVPAAADGAPSFYYRDPTPGTAVLTATSQGYIAAAVRVTVTPSCAVSPLRGAGTVVIAAHARTAAGARLLLRRAVPKLRGTGFHARVVRDTCTDFVVAITGIPTRASGLALVRRLKLVLHSAALSRR